MTETTIERDTVLAALQEHVTDADRESDAGQAVIDDLHARLRAISPEARAGDPAALAQLEKIEQAIAAEKRRQQIEELADAELAQREHAKADAELETQRKLWRGEKTTAEKARDTAFSKFERAITSALEAAKVGIEANASAADLAKRLDLQAGPDYRMLVENRILRRVYDELGVYGVKPGILMANEGRTPLATEAASCAVCEHEHRGEIESERAGGASLRVLAERHSVGKSTLSEHFREHAEA